MQVNEGPIEVPDHVVLLDDATLAIAQEIVRAGALSRVHIGLDYFDASISRIAAWIIGARNMRKALLLALLEPIEKATRRGKTLWRHLTLGAL